MAPNSPKKPRRPFHYAARIFADQNRPLIACTITDISESGARVILGSDEDLPDRFVLLLTQNGCARRSCRIAWRDGLDIDVAFADDNRAVPVKEVAKVGRISESDSIPE